MIFSGIQDRTKVVTMTSIFLLTTMFFAKASSTCVYSNITFANSSVKTISSTMEASMSYLFHGTDSDPILTWSIAAANGTISIALGQYTGGKLVVQNGNLSFGISGKNLSSTVRFMISAFHNNSRLLFRDNRCDQSLSLPSSVIEVKYCDTEEIRNTTNQTATVKITTDSKHPVYNTKGNCACKEPGYLYDREKEMPANGSVWCNDIAEWQGCENVQCWSAPIITYVSQGSNYSNTSANLKCVYDSGFPVETNRIFLIGNEIVLWDKILKSSDHNMQCKCKADNEYTRDIGKPVVSSIRLEVFFSPEITKRTESPIVIGLNNRTDVSFDFQANPASGNIILTFSMPNGSMIEEKTFEQNSSDVNYNVQYTITINSSMDYGNYIFTVRTDDPNGCDSESIKIVNETVTTTASPTTTPTNPNTTHPDPIYIAIGCSGAVVLIIVLVVFLIIYRKRKGKSASDEDIKEERENPLYSSAPGPSPNAEYATVDKSKKKQEKEEKVNPIYQGTSAGADADTVEEAYAAIDIKKKRKKKEKNNEGSENSAFDPEATYAAVNKPKKKKNVEPPPDVVYSAVQKKKKNDQPSDTDLHV